MLLLIRAPGVRGFKLQRGMADTVLGKLLMQLSADLLAFLEVAEDHMSGQRVSGGAERPDVKVVNGGHTGICQQLFPDGFNLDSGGNAVQRQTHALLEQSPGGKENHHGDHQPDHWIDEVPAGPKNQHAGKDHPHRDPPWRQ